MGIAANPGYRRVGARVVPSRGGAVHTLGRGTTMSANSYRRERREMDSVATAGIWHRRQSTCVG
jgi:hypothetical protein